MRHSRLSLLSLALLSLALLSLALLSLALLLSPARAFSAAALDLQQQGLSSLTITWSGAPADATIVYGKAVVGRGAAGSVAIDPAQITPGRAAVLLDGAAGELARAVTMGAQIARDSEGVTVRWSAPEPVCLVLVGGGLRDARLADVPCARAGETLLRRGGDYLLSPVGRERVSLRAQSDLTREVAGVGLLWRLVLPVVVGR